MDDRGVGDERDQPPHAAAVGTEQDVHIECPFHQLRPRAPSLRLSLPFGVQAGARGCWNDGVPPRSRRGEDTVVGQQGTARAWNQGGQAFDEGERVEDEMGRAIAPRTTELMRHSSVGTTVPSRSCEKYSCGSGCTRALVMPASLLQSAPLGCGTEGSADRRLRRSPGFSLQGAAAATGLTPYSMPSSRTLAETVLFFMRALNFSGWSVR